MKKCLGEYNYKKEGCLDCPQRIKCMMRKFNKLKTLNSKFEWSEQDEEPSCFGSHKVTKECLECPFGSDCIKQTKEIKSKTLRKGKKIRLTGKYKERGRYKPKDVY